ncbi:MAG: hypothetical protein ACN6O2_03520 [Stenotrophomonas sp.]
MSLALLRDLQQLWTQRYWRAAIIVVTLPARSASPRWVALAPPLPRPGRPAQKRNSADAQHHLQLRSGFKAFNA